MRSIAIIVGLALAGCATEPPPPEVKIQTVTIVSSDFCQTMKAAFPPHGKTSWDVKDQPRSIDDDLKLERIVDKRCGTRGSNSR
jgi:hypothetical protein